MKPLMTILFGTIQRTSATFMILGGIASPFLLTESRIVTAVAAVMTALGGALLSASMQETESLGKKVFNPRIIPAARHLVNSINQLVSIVIRVEKEELD